MRRLVLAAVAVVGLVAVGPAFATGFGGSDSPPARIPVVSKDYSATVEDEQGVRVDVTQVSYNGETFLYGTVGEGQVTVPFDKIAQIRVELANEPTKRTAVVVLKDGGMQSVTIDDDILAYGKTAYGNYSIEMGKIRKIDFKGLTPTQQPTGPATGNQPQPPAQKTP